MIQVEFGISNVSILTLEALIGVEGLGRSIGTYCC